MANLHHDTYKTMLDEGGYSHEEIQKTLRPELEKAGFADQEIAAYFNSYTANDTASDGSPGIIDSFVHGVQGSVSGLWWREQLPDAINPQELEKIDWMDRIAMSAGTLLGDAPTIIAGGAMGLLGGASAPVTVPAGAMALTEGTRASFIDIIENGKIDDFWYAGGLFTKVLPAAGKGALIGGATGGAGALAGSTAIKAGAGTLGKTAATVTAEVATMPTVTAGLENRFPHPQEFVDAALFIGTLRAGMHGVQAVSMQSAQIVPKLRNIYVKTGKTPKEVAEAAQKDPSIVEDVLAVNRDIPGAFAKETLDKIVRNEEGPTEIPVDPYKPALPEGKTQVTDAVKLSDVVTYLEKELDIPIRFGKMGATHSGAKGIYKVSPEVARSRVANDIPTIIHEIGHHIQKKLFGSFDEAPLREFAHELEAIATIPKKGQSALPEGFAEFVAKYVVNPEQAKSVAPKFFEHFEKLMDSQAPELKSVLHNVQGRIKLWAEQPAALEVLSHMSVDGKPMGNIGRILQENPWERVYTDYVDRLFPLKKATELLANGEELPADMNPYVLARTFQGAKGKATHFIEHAPFEFSTLKNVGEPLAHILRDVDDMNLFRTYIVSRRGVELTSQGRKAGPRPEAMQGTINALKDKYEPLAQRLGEYQDHLVNYIVDAGLMDKEAAGLMREMNKNYVPFYRVLEDSGGFMGGGKSMQGKSPIKRLKGSGRDIVDPIESIIKNTYAFIEAAEKNAIGKALVDLAHKTEGAGWLVEKLPEPKKAVRVNKSDVQKSFLTSLGEVDSVLMESVKSMTSEAGIEGVSTFWQNAYTLDKTNQIAVYSKGKRGVYQVDPEVAKVMHGLNVEQIPLFVQLLSVPAKMLRAGATLTPDFMVRNLMRDAVAAGVQSRTGFVPGLDTVKGLKHAVMRDELYWRWVKSGGDQATLVSMDRTTLQRTLKEITATGYTEKVWNVVKNPLEALRLASELSEQTTRLGEFARAEKQFGSNKAGLTRAALESREVSMDFARRGNMTQSWNMMTAFFNAQVQGLDRLALAFRENPKKAIIGATAYIAVPSVLLAIHNYGDERVQEVPRAMRDIFWIVPVGETLVRIPKPFEAGVIFGSTLERATEFVLDAYTDKYKGDINKARQEAFRGLGKSYWDFAKPPVVPNVAQPFIETFANRSLAFDRAIIPYDREGMLPEYQYAPYTTELAKAAAHAVGTLPAVGQMNTFSPAMAENWIRSWGGGLGKYSVEMLDFVGRKAGWLPDPVLPDWTLADMPFVKAFIVRHPSMGAESIQRFYDRHEEVQKYMATINGLQKEFKYEEASNLMSYTAYKSLDGPRKALGQISRFVYMVHAAPTISSHEKRQLIDGAYRQAVGIAREGNKAYEMLKDDVERLKKRAGK